MSRIVVVGAGVGGLAVAIRLAQAGHDVVVHERSGVVGGKLGVHERDGFRFDTGPSLLTLPQVFDDLRLGLTPEPLDPLVRHVFPDGSVLDSSSDPEVFRTRIADAFGPAAADDWSRFFKRARKIWDASWEPVLQQPVTPATLLRLSWRVRSLWAIAPGTSLRALGRRYLRDPRLRVLLDRYATYTGADPRRAPAALAAIPYAELAFGGWYLPGGLGTIATALADRARTLGVEIVLNSRVAAIEHSATHVTGIRLATPAGGSSGRFREPENRPVLPLPHHRDADAKAATGSDAAAGTSAGAGAGANSGAGAAASVFEPADIVVSNVDALTTYRELLPAPERLAGLADRSLAGFVLLLGVRGRTPSLAHHTVFFPRDYDAEFDAIFGDPGHGRRARPADDPTIFVTRADDPAVRPDGKEAWFVLVNAPPHGTGTHAVDWRRPGLAEAYRDLILAKLAARGLDVRDRLEFAEIRTPADLADSAAAPGGAIYGTAGGLLRPANRGPVEGLYLVGGSTHPGGGLPMVTLSARIVADQITRATHR